MSEQAPVVAVKESSDSDEAHVAVPGRQRKAWLLIGTDELQAGEDLRKGAQRWLRAKGIPHKTLTKSSNKGATTMIARCSACKQCSKAWCFSLISDSLRIERHGECSDDKDLDRLRRFHARRYAKEFTPANALKATRKAGIDPEERPKTWQVKSQRPKKNPSNGVSLSCLGDLKAFVSSPPEGVFIYTEECICLSVSCKAPCVAFSKGSTLIDKSVSQRMVHACFFLISLSEDSCYSMLRPR